VRELCGKGGGGAGTAFQVGEFLAFGGRVLLGGGELVLGDAEGFHGGGDLRRDLLRNVGDGGLRFLGGCFGGDSGVVSGFETSLKRLVFRDTGAHRGELVAGGGVGGLLGCEGGYGFIGTGEAGEESGLARSGALGGGGGSGGGRIDGRSRSGFGYCRGGRGVSFGHATRQVSNKRSGGGREGEMGGLSEHIPDGADGFLGVDAKGRSVAELGGVDLSKMADVDCLGGGAALGAADARGRRDEGRGAAKGQADGEREHHALGSVEAAGSGGECHGRGEGEWERGGGGGGLAEALEEFGEGVG